MYLIFFKKTFVSALSIDSDCQSKVTPTVGVSLTLGVIESRSLRVVL